MQRYLQGLNYQKRGESIRLSGRSTHFVLFFEDIPESTWAILTHTTNKRPHTHLCKHIITSLTLSKYK